MKEHLLPQRTTRASWGDFVRLWQLSCAGAWRAATHSLPQMLLVLALVGGLLSLIGWFFGTQWWNPLYLPVVVVARGMHLHLGWQLQGSQFRRAAVYHDQSISGRSQESRRLRENVSREQPEFYSFPAPLPQTLGGRKEFNHFAPSFVYKYVKTPNLTISELRAAAAGVHAEVEQLRAEGAAEHRPVEAVRKAP